MDIEIRRAGPSDIDELSRVALAGFDAYIARDFKAVGVAELHRFFSAEAMRERATQGNRLWMALDANTAVGMLELKPPAHLLSLFVAPGRTAQGIGGKLVGRCAEHIRERWPDETVLTVNSAPSSVPAYQRMGFRSAGEAFEKNDVRSFPMALDLTAFQDPTTR